MNIDFLQSSIYFGWNNCRNYFHWRNKISVCIYEYNKEARTKPKSGFRRKRGDFCNNLFDIWCPPIHCFHCVWIVIGHFFFWIVILIVVYETCGGALKRPSNRIHFDVNTRRCLQLHPLKFHYPIYRFGHTMDLVRQFIHFLANCFRCKEDTVHQVGISSELKHKNPAQPWHYYW